ncbi:hypothetical protein NLJ89_g167 [Agrocybe chaxingu]|uniref:Nucleoporin NSP1 n=1 Tax=Agrocybe chaxingu TaxID=84603 RepID=A0A9W8TFH5_9AGAR|nr:hypothetical protein NLJ89_g167 [Agrocybe chaxingu]
MSFFNPPGNNTSSTPAGGATGGGLFGGGNTNSTGNTNVFGAGIFGGGGTPNAGGTPSPFGNADTTTGSTAAPASTSGGIFGNANRTTTTPATGGGLFGGGTANTSSTPAGGLFGAGGASTTASNPPSGLFGGANASSTTPATGTTGGLFGGGTTNASTTPAAGGLFGGAKSNTAPAPATNTNPLFGGGTSAFSLPKSADNGAPKPPASSFFSQPNTSSTPAAGATSTAPGTGFFSLPPKPADSAGRAAPSTSTGPSTTSATAGGGLFGSGLFGKPTATTAAPASSSATSPFSVGGDKKDATSTSTPAGGLFGAPPAANKDAEKKDTSPAAAFPLFGAAKPDEKKDTSVTAAKEGDKPAGTVGASTAVVVAIPPPSMLRGKTLEEIVNRWSSDLETNVREFNRFAAEVEAWDRTLIENGNNIAALYSHVVAAERQQNEINEALDHIEQQQKDLASTLDAYEKVSQEILGTQGASLRTLDAGPADNERDKNYMLATDLHTHLDDISGSLTQMIDSVNGLSIASKPDDSTNDPMSQIAQVLSSHLESLQWIDAAVREVEGKATDVEKRIKESGHTLSGSTSKPRGFGLNR